MSNGITGVMIRRTGHPWHGGLGFDVLEFDTEDLAASERFVARARERFWHVWLVGVSDDGASFGGLLYRPSGVRSEWHDAPGEPHPGGLGGPARRRKFNITLAMETIHGKAKFGRLRLLTPAREVTEQEKSQ